MYQPFNRIHRSKVMLGKLCVIYFLYVVRAQDGGEIITEPKKIKFKNGVEFANISRGILLKILSAFEEDINSKLDGKQLSPRFNVKFANNKYTNRFIYPQIKKISSGSVPANAQ